MSHFLSKPELCIVKAGCFENLTCVEECIWHCGNVCYLYSLLKMHVASGNKAFSSVYQFSFASML